MTDNRIIGLVILVSTLLLILGIFVSIEDFKQWENFKTEHDCKIVSRVPSTVSIGTGINPSNGAVIIVNTITQEKNWLFV